MGIPTCHITLGGTSARGVDGAVTVTGVLAEGGVPISRRARSAPPVSVRRRRENFALEDPKQQIYYEKMKDQT